MIELVGLTLLLFAVFAVTALVLAVLKVVIWVVLLPLRLLFGVLLVPLAAAQSRHRRARPLHRRPVLAIALLAALL